MPRSYPLPNTEYHEVLQAECTKEEVTFWPRTKRVFPYDEHIAAMMSDDDDEQVSRKINPIYQIWVDRYSKIALNYYCSRTVIFFFSDIL